MHAGPHRRSDDPIVAVGPEGYERRPTSRRASRPGSPGTTAATQAPTGLQAGTLRLVEALAALHQPAGRRGTGPDERRKLLQIVPFVDVELQTRVSKHVRAHAACLRLRQVTHEAVRTEVRREERGRRPENRVRSRAVARRNQNDGWSNPQGLKNSLDVCRFNQGNIDGQTEKGLHASLGAVTRSGVHRIALRNLAGLGNRLPPELSRPQENLRLLADNKDAIRAILRRDPGWCVYALGDLSLEMFPKTEWFTPDLSLVLKDYGTILYQFGLGAAALKVIQQ